ncbi:hypothetical protein [Streptomyces spiramenti]|uniref:Uncharacterized protein n=1 Tax=Streptomyces spiramenti TaxID=2720606 RepID=A0ABX1ASS2_9ACTN|nr:hypothetical protein [Streptomyces spiramenti]NJP67803.1 hypothetical protein [Streptomyces spiramenti]
MKSTTVLGTALLLTALVAATPAHATVPPGGSGQTYRPAPETARDAAGFGDCLAAVPGAERPLFRLSERADRRCPAPHVIAHS